VQSVSPHQSYFQAGKGKYQVTQMLEYSSSPDSDANEVESGSRPRTKKMLGVGLEDIKLLFLATIKGSLGENKKLEIVLRYSWISFFTKPY
jgi:hypothetical protein